MSGPMPTFSLGTAEKMNMSLDEIVKKSDKKGPKARQVGKKAAMNNNSSANNRRKQLVNTTNQRSSNLRKAKFDSMRGIEYTSAPEKKNVRVARTTDRFAVNRARGTLTRQKQLALRKKNANKKVQQYNQQVGITVTVPSRGNVRQSQAARLRVQRGGVNSRRLTVTQRFANRGINTTGRLRRGVQNRQTLGARRGIQTSNLGSRTINDRFSNGFARGGGGRGRGGLRGNTRGQGRIIRGGRGGARGGTRGGTRGGARGGRGGRGGFGNGGRRVTYNQTY